MLCVMLASCLRAAVTLHVHHSKLPSCYVRNICEASWLAAKYVGQHKVKSWANTKHVLCRHRAQMPQASAAAVCPTTIRSAEPKLDSQHSFCVFKPKSSVPPSVLSPHCHPSHHLAPIPSFPIRAVFPPSCSSCRAAGRAWHPCQVCHCCDCWLSLAVLPVFKKMLRSCIVATHFTMLCHIHALPHAFDTSGLTLCWRAYHPPSIACFTVLGKHMQKLNSHKHTCVLCVRQHNPVTGSKRHMCLQGLGMCKCGTGVCLIEAETRVQ